MKDVTSSNFGLLIAYVLPGFILLWGIAPFSPPVQSWLGNGSENPATIGGFLYVTIASVGVGQLVSTVRWLLIDTLHHYTGITKPDWNYRYLKDTVTAFDRLIEDHYRFYQAHANTLVSATLAIGLRWLHDGFSWQQCLLLVLIDGLLWAASRDNLSKYYRRVECVLSGS